MTRRGLLALLAAAIIPQRDDGPTLQALIDSIQPGETLAIRPGTYYIDTRVNLRGRSGFDIQRCTFIAGRNNTDGMFILDGTTRGTLSNCDFDGTRTQWSNKRFRIGRARFGAA